MSSHAERRAASARVTRALAFGMVAVNRAKITGAPIPFGGFKQSGLGREGSRHGMEAFTELKYVCLDWADRHRLRIRVHDSCVPCECVDIEEINDMLTNDQLALWDRDHFFHPSTHMAPACARRDPLAHHHRRRRRLHRGPRRQAQPRRLRRPLLRQCRLRPPRDRRCDRRRRRSELAYYHAYVGHGTEASITLAKMIIDRAPKGMSQGLLRPRPVRTPTRPTSS